MGRATQSTLECHDKVRLNDLSSLVAAQLPQLVREAGGQTHTALASGNGSQSSRIAADPVGTTPTSMFGRHAGCPAQVKAVVPRWSDELFACAAYLNQHPR